MTGGMRSVADNKKSETDFYLTNVVPLNQQRTTPFRYVDMVLMTVLFLEVGGLIRLLLAK
jgi:hypothetical protein